MKSLFEFESQKNTCYKVKNKFYDYTELEDISLNAYLNNNFVKHDININNNIDSFNEDPYNECKEKTLYENKDFFLIGDFTINNSDLAYTCYIPKEDSSYCLTNDFNDLKNISTIDNLFGIKGYRRPNNISVNILNNLTESSFNEYTEQSCIRYKNKSTSVILPRNNRFLLYKKKVLENSEIENIDINNINVYTGESGTLNLVNLQNTYNSFKSNIRSSLYNDLCIKKDFTSLTETKNSIKNMNDFYINIFQNLDLLNKDISNLSIMTKYDTEYLKTVKDNIDENKKKLKNIFSIDGANNGKFLDIKYRKNQKLQEIIIISLLLIFLIFFYSKKK